MRRPKPFILCSDDRTKLRKRLLSALGHGRHNAITGSRLAALSGDRDDRLVRVFIRELIKEGVPIASSVSEPMGFFIVNTGEEAADYIRVLKNRIREDEARLRDFEEAVQTFSPPEQLALIGG